MDFVSGRLYFIKDEFFEIVGEEYLKMNKDDTQRPHYYTFKMVKPEIPLALDGGMNGVRGNYYKLLEKQKSSQISITISPDFCL